MGKIVFTRVDNRLVHGQVGCVWANSVHANLLVVADDAVSKDPLQQQLMGITAKNAGIAVRFFSIQHTIDIIHKASDAQHIFIVVRTVASALSLVRGGVPIDKVNLGNLHFDEGKRKLSSKVYVNDEDMKQIEELKKLNVHVFIQDLPTEEKTTL